MQKRSKSEFQAAQLRKFPKLSAIAKIQQLTMFDSTKVYKILIAILSQKINKFEALHNNIWKKSNLFFTVCLEMTVHS